MANNFEIHKDIGRLIIFFNNFGDLCASNRSKKKSVE